MNALATFVLARRRWVIVGWLLLAVAGGVAAPLATGALSYDFGLPGQPGYETNQRIEHELGAAGENPPVLLAVGDGRRTLSDADGAAVAAAVRRASPGARIASFADESQLYARDRRTAVVLVYPRPLANAPEPYAKALPAIEQAAAASSRRLGVTVEVTGADALAEGGGGGSPSVLVETLVGGIGALVVLVVVFGSFLALSPLVVAAGSILATFLALWGFTELTDVSFIVQYLLALIGLGVAIDYALLIVTRWREERGRGADPDDAVRLAMATAGRSVLFSGVTVAVSLAALIALPVPFLRSVGITGLLIPLVSVAAALTLLPALLRTAGPRLAWPHRRGTDPESRFWRRTGSCVVRRRWFAAAAATVVLLALAAPVLGLRLGQPTNDSLASKGGTAADAVTRIEDARLGAGLTQPVLVVIDDPSRVIDQLRHTAGVGGAVAPEAWRAGGDQVMAVWTYEDASSADGAAAAARIRDLGERAGAEVGGLPVQNSDFVDAVYGNAWWIALIVVVVTFVLLARALRSVVLPIKALALNVLSIAAAYGVTVLVWQHGIGTELLFRQSASGAITVWVPVAAFAFLFGLSMDYEVFLLARIREEYDRTGDTDAATSRGVARTGRLVSSAALILFLAFVSLSQVPTTDVKILATTLALGIVLDATVVRGALAPALVAALGRANWWWPFPRRRVSAS